MESKMPHNITLKDFTRFVSSGTNISFTKFGDGEVSCMKSWSFGMDMNSDGDRYSRWLGKALKSAFVYLAGRSDVYIGQWHRKRLVDYLTNLAKKQGINHINWAPYHFVMNASPVEGATDYDSFTNKDMLEFAKAIKYSNRKKVIFSNSSNIRLKDFFSAQTFVETTKNNWSFKYEYYRDKVAAECGDDVVLLTAAGMCSKVLIADLLKRYRMTCIDIGSGFDLIVTGKHSRPWKHSYQDELNYYQEILPDSWEV